MELKTKSENDKKLFEAEKAKYKKNSDKVLMDDLYAKTKAYYDDKNGAKTDVDGKEAEMKTAKGEVEKLKPKPDLKVIDTAAASESNLKLYIDENFSVDVPKCTASVDKAYKVQQAVADQAGN